MLDPMSSPPTARRQRIGSELRKMRDAAGVTTAEAAAVLGLARTKVTLIEQGSYTVTPERVIALADRYKESDSEYVHALAEMAGERAKGWWEEYRGSVPAGFLEIAEFEFHAKGMHSYQICHPPGPMQTERYSRAVFVEAQPPLTPRIIETRVEHRMKRSEILMRGGAEPYTALVHEAALRMRFGGREVTREQLDWMLELSHLPHVTLRVVPFESGGFVGSGQAIIYANGPVPRLDTVQYDSVDGPIYLHSTEYLDKYSAIIAKMTDRSLSADDSRDLISTIKREM
ncbi:helix-turn-helix domain-containing protein [Kitasatospora sp. NPDC086009]|uniref:helix-turn-helix domain-containing protein n=1 Tax=unclassified Kitasatospora TaxID=2633591 RepID=UPI0037CC0E56